MTGPDRPTIGLDYEERMRQAVETLIDAYRSEPGMQLGSDPDLPVDIAAHWEEVASVIQRQLSVAYHMDHGCACADCTATKWWTEAELEDVQGHQQIAQWMQRLGDAWHAAARMQLAPRNVSGHDFPQDPLGRWHHDRLALHVGGLEPMPPALPVAEAEQEAER
jgi:hypothetical protein